MRLRDTCDVDAVIRQISCKVLNGIWLSAALSTYNDGSGDSRTATVDVNVLQRRTDVLTGLLHSVR